VFHSITTISTEELVDSCHRENQDTQNIHNTKADQANINSINTIISLIPVDGANRGESEQFSRGGGNKGPPPKKQAQLGFSQGKAGSALKASKKKQCLNTPGQGKMRAGVEDNGGGGGIGAGNTDKGPKFATPRRGSSLPPSWGWAEACACLHEGENTVNIQGNNRERGEVTTDNGEESPLQGTRLSCKFSMLALDGFHIATTGSFPHLKEGDESKLGLAHDPYKGKNFLKWLIILLRGRFNNSITKSTNLLLAGDLPVEATVEKAVSKGVRQVNYARFQSIIYGKLSPAEELYTPTPGTTDVSYVLGPPAIQRDAEMPDTEEMVTGAIRWSNLKSKKRKSPTITPDQSALVAGSEGIRPTPFSVPAKTKATQAHQRDSCYPKGAPRYSQGPSDGPSLYGSRYHPVGR
jgi:hypothetical protein